MAKHKAATEVTLRTEEPPLLEQWVKNHWPKAAIAGLVVTGIVLFMHFQSKKQAASVGADWDKLPGVSDEDHGLAVYQAARESVAGTPVEGWALLQEAGAAMGEENLDAAVAALSSLKGKDDHILNRLTFPLGKDGADITLGQRLADRMAAQKDWEETNSDLFTNPDPAAGSPVVRLKTSSGDIEIALYEEQSPEHVANFLKHIEDNYYNGTLFHRVVNQPSMGIVQGGDPNTLDEEKLVEWGQGGPDYGIQAEKNGLVHDVGYLSAAMPPGGGTESNGSQFFLTFTRCHHLDGRHTIFGKITSGLDIVEEMGEAEIRVVEDNPAVRDVPVDPVVLNSVELVSE